VMLMAKELRIKMPLRIKMFLPYLIRYGVPSFSAIEKSRI